VVPVGAPATVVTQGPVASVIAPVGALMPVAKKGSPAGGWPWTAPAAMTTRVLMAAAAAKVPMAPTTGSAGALTPTVMKGGPAGGWGHAAAVAPTAVPTTTPTTRS
jgi:hypothetical protein